MKPARMGPVLIMALLASLVGPMLWAAPAFACSCSAAPFSEGNQPEPEATVFVGTVTGQHVDGQHTTWTFDVESVLQGELGTAVAVETATNGATCGFEREAIGDRRSVILRSSAAGEWRSDLCSIDNVAASTGFGTPQPPDPAIASPTAIPADAATGASTESASHLAEPEPVGDDLLLPIVGGVMLATFCALALGVTLGRKRRSPRRRKSPV